MLQFFGGYIDAALVPNGWHEYMLVIIWLMRKIQASA